MRMMQLTGMPVMLRPAWDWVPFLVGRKGTAMPSRQMCKDLKGRLVGVRASQDVLPLDFRTEVKDVEALALRLARQAGAFIQRKSGHILQIASKSSRSDLVTEVDKDCEELIHSEVKAVFPKHLWLGEESATADQLKRLEEGPGDSKWTWIVDPIDGTTNFVGGVPYAAVSIAVARGSSLEVGVVYNPFIDELFQATKDHGAFLNGKKISVLPYETELEDAVVTVGFHSKPENRVMMLEAISKVGPSCRGVLAMGSSALQISYVAAGRVGCFFEVDLKAWDIAAARLILEEAGGYISGMDGKPLSLIGGSALASNGGILHRRILQLLG